MRKPVLQLQSQALIVGIACATALPIPVLRAGDGGGYASSSIVEIEIAKRQMKNGGGIVCFELKGGLAAGRKFLDGLGMLSLTANLGDTRSIASHPASTTHAKLTEQERADVGITPGLIRISVGLEHREDILGDISQAL